MKASIFYSGLKESREVKGWNKQTVKYAIENESDVRKTIAGIAKNIYSKTLQSADIDDVYMDVMQYFYDCDDYDITKAIYKSSKDVPVSLEGYIYSCIKFCVLRHISKESKSVKTVSETTQNGEDEASLFNLIADETEESDGMTLEEILQMYEHKRYCVIEDIYTIWFIGLIAMRENKEECYEDIMEVFGINSKNLESSLSKEEQGIMYQIAKAITAIDIEEAILAFRKYVYGADTIEKTIIGM